MGDFTPGAESHGSGLLLKVQIGAEDRADILGLQLEGTRGAHSLGEPLAGGRIIYPLAVEAGGELRITNPSQ